MHSTPVISFFLSFNFFVVLYSSHLYCNFHWKWEEKTFLSSCSFPQCASVQMDFSLWFVDIIKCHIDGLTKWSFMYILYTQHFIFNRHFSQLTHKRNGNDEMILLVWFTYCYICHIPKFVCGWWVVGPVQNWNENKTKQFSIESAIDKMTHTKTHSIHLKWVLISSIHTLLASFALPFTLRTHEPLFEPSSSMLMLISSFRKL